MIRSHFARGVSEQGDLQKAVSKGWCKESRFFYTFCNFGTEGSATLLSFESRVMLSAGLSGEKAATYASTSIEQTQKTEFAVFNHP